MTTKNRAKLTGLDVEVLRAAAREDGSTWRSEAIHDLYDSYLWNADRGRTKVNRQVKKLTGGGEPLLAIGQQEGTRRPWLLTAAGRQALDNAQEQ